MDNSVKKELSQLLYQLFVTNTYAMAFQRDDGKYTTKYLPVSSFVIEEMLANDGSLGCYQQCYKSNKLRWICFDFDCPDKVNPDVKRLYHAFVCPFLDILRGHGISFLTEFSGRRGIHVWIIFDALISKKDAFAIVCALRTELFETLGSENVHIDYFPATDSSRGNVVGKQVKIPLSVHKSGGRSWLFDGDFHPRDDVMSDTFFSAQLEILRKYSSNSFESVFSSLGLKRANPAAFVWKYKKYLIVGEMEITVSDAMEILSETAVYDLIFRRMRLGHAGRLDWVVLLGTFSQFDDADAFIHSLFSLFPNYDVKTTVQNIRKYKDKYFPATFAYLYRLYDLQIEPELNPEDTGFHYLLSRLGLVGVSTEVTQTPCVKENFSGIYYTIHKECNYLLINDEVPNVMIWNQLKFMKGYDRYLMERKIDNILETGSAEYALDYQVYIRRESEEKTRKMVSLGAENRVLTTQVALKLCDKLNLRWRSFSYQVSFISKEDIFYNWFSSWGEYINRIKVFLEIPFLSSYKVFVMDLKGFYDHVDFLSVYDIFKSELNNEAGNLFRFLISYNEKLMQDMNEGSRIGVPQGPAYARIIAEMYLDRVLQIILQKYNPKENKQFYLYRYVDDIIVLYQPDFAGERLYKELAGALLSYGLPLNMEKSKCYGTIASLTERERAQILRKDKFIYDLQDNDYRGYLSLEERRRDVKKYLRNNEFDISVIGYIFGNRTYKYAADEYFRLYAKLIFESRIGRGINFRRFYRYILQNSALFRETLDTGLLWSIPVDTINFGNFLGELYLLTQDHALDEKLFCRLQEEYLSKFKENVRKEEDKIVIHALLLICYKGVYRDDE